MHRELNYYDIFVPGGYPPYTYNPRTTLSLEQHVESVLHNLCKLVVVTGHTKSGKTVLVQKILPRDQAIWVDGGSAVDEDEFWTIVIDQLDLFQTVGVQEDSARMNEATGETSVEGSIVLAKGGAKLGARLAETTGQSYTYSRTSTAKSTALAGLRRSRVPLIIDDFHYLPKTVQGKLIRALKPLIFDGVPVVIIAIPHRRYEAVKVEKEMTGRILAVSVPAWSVDDLAYISNTGFPLLGLSLPERIGARLATEAIGSPHLMQEFCRELSKRLTYLPDDENVVTEPILDEMLKVTAETTIGRPIFEKLARGPRQRSDRITRTLISGEDVDIYGLVLSGLAHIKPGLVTLEYEDLRTAIKEICVPENVPSLQEVARVLKHMAEISATDESSTPVIDFDEDDKRLHITDPFFAFYLRWGDIRRQPV